MPTADGCGCPLACVSNPRGLLFFGLALACLSVTISVTVCELGFALAAFAALSMSRPGAEAGAFKSLSAEQLRPVLAAWLFYLVVGLAASVLGVDFRRSFSALGSDLVKACVFILLLFAVDKQLGARLKPYYIAGACLSAVWGLGQFLHGLGTGAGYVRAGGSLNAITYSEVTALAAIAAFAASFYETGKLRLFYGAAAVLISAAVLASQGRASLAALTGALCIMAFAGVRRQRKIVLAVLAAILLAVGLFATRSQRMKSVPVFLASLYGSVTGNPQPVDRNVSGWDRLEMWRTGARIWRDYPVFGVGPANIRKVFDFYHPQPMSGGQGQDFGLANVHNLFLQQAAERGAAGLAAVLALFCVMFSAALAWFRRRPDGDTLWLLVALPAFVLMNLTETSFQHALPAFSVSLAFAFSASGARET